MINHTIIKTIFLEGVITPIVTFEGFYVAFKLRMNVLLEVYEGLVGLICIRKEYFHK